MTVTSTNAMGGPITLWVGTFGATEPVNAGTAPATDWTQVGGTEGGATLTLTQGYTNYAFDQIAMSPGADLSSQAVSVATNLAEPTLANLRVAANQAVDAATDLELFGDDLTNDAPNYQAVLLQGKKPGGGPRMWVVRRCLSTKDIGIPFKKDGQTVFPVEFTGYYVSASITAVRVDDTPGS